MRGDTAPAPGSPRSKGADEALPAVRWGRQETHTQRQNVRAKAKGKHLEKGRNHAGGAFPGGGRDLREDWLARAQEPAPKVVERPVGRARARVCVHVYARSHAGTASLSLWWTVYLQTQTKSKSLNCGKHGASLRTSWGFCWICGFLAPGSQP